MSAPRLHLLLHPDALDDATGQLSEADRLVLLDRGVEWLARPGGVERLQALACGVIVSRVDVHARGLRLGDAFEAVDDAELAALVVAHEQVLSWT